MEFIKEEMVVCVISCRTTLEIGKEYKILDISNYQRSNSDMDKQEILLDLGDGNSSWYHSFRFISKATHRNNIINQIID